MSSVLLVKTTAPPVLHVLAHTTSMTLPMHAIVRINYWLISNDSQSLQSNSILHRCNRKILSGCMI